MAESENPETGAHPVPEGVGEGSDPIEVIPDRPKAQGPAAIVVPAEVFGEIFRQIGQRSHPRVTRFLGEPFKLDDEIFRRIDAQVRSQIVTACSIDPTFRAEVVLADRSSEQFFDIDELVERSGIGPDPESLHITWQSVDPMGAFLEVDLAFITEKPYDGPGTSGPMHSHTGATLAVIGPLRDWVRSTADELMNLVAYTGLPKLFKPLYIFRSELYREVSAWIVGAIFFFLSSELLWGLTRGPAREGKVEAVLGEEGLDARFEEFIRQLYKDDRSFVLGFLLFMVPYGLFFVGVLLGRRYLAYFVPKSSIALGLRSRRYDDYLNAFRFVVFTVLVAAFVGLSVNFVSGLIF